MRDGAALQVPTKRGRKCSTHLMARSPAYFSSAAPNPEPGSASAAERSRLPRLTWVPLLARLVLETLGSTTRLLVMIPASRSLATACSWLRLSTWWQSSM